MSEKDIKEEKDEAQEIEIEIEGADKEPDNDPDLKAVSSEEDAGEDNIKDIDKEADESTEGSEESDDDGEEEGLEDDTDPEGKEKKKLFGKKKEKKDKKDEQIEALTDRVKRQMAEFENFRKRTEKEKSSMYEMGAKSVVEKILPVIDNFERGLDTVPEDEADSPFTEGMRMIYKQLMTELENIGVKPIEALGTEFNPDFHNAVMQVESEEYESGYVAQELQKGYMYRDTVVRHSMVAVVS